MQWTHPDHPGRRVRLAYCLNLHPSPDLDGLLAGMRRVTLPLRERVGRSGSFGVGPWIPSALALRLASDDGAGELDELAAFLRAEQLDAFTFNAFPAGDFHRAGLKADVYRPAWDRPERVAFTVAVAEIAARLARDRGRSGGAAPDAHVSISTHTGGYDRWVEGAADLHGYLRGMAEAVRALARLEQRGGPRVVLSLEAEPHASATDNRELFGFCAFARAEIARALAAEFRPVPGRAAQARAAPEHAAAWPLALRHLGVCLDACHSAVSFEAEDEALLHATRSGPLGKLQFSSALALDRPAERTAARERLLAMDEPRYLHQVVGRRGPLRRSARDLPELRADLSGPAAADWLACDAWRCHFHVPVDLERAGELGTTRAHADQLLRSLLAAPHDWDPPELHVEIETYTWDVLPPDAAGASAGDGSATSPEALVDGLEREYLHVISLLEAAGWNSP